MIAQAFVFFWIDHKICERRKKVKPCILDMNVVPYQNQENKAAPIVCGGDILFSGV